MLGILSPLPASAPPPPLLLSHFAPSPTPPLHLELGNARNVWCKDLAAATTAVFRNKAALTPALSSSSSSSQNHRRSSSASSDLAGGEGGNNLGRSSRNSSGSSTSKAAANGAANTSPGSSGNRTSASTPPLPLSSTATTVPPSAASGSLGRAVDSAPAVAATVDYGQPPRKPDAIAAAVGAAFPGMDGGGAGGACPFSGHAASGAAAAGKAFSSEVSGAMAAPTSFSSSSRLLYNGKKDKGGVVPDSRGGAPSQESRVCSLTLLKNSASNASPAPETPPPPPSRRGSRASNGSAGSGGLGNGGSAYTNAAMESPPRTYRRASQLGNMTPDPRAMPTAVPAVIEGSGVAGGAPGARGSGRRLTTGRWGGCPLPEDIQRAMEQEQRKTGLDKAAPPAGGGGDGGGGSGSGMANGQTDVSVFLSFVFSPRKARQRQTLSCSEERPTRPR